MKPAPFSYHRAASVAEATGLLADLGEEAQLLAGGQSLVPMMNLRLARPAHLIDINPIKDLALVESGPEGVVIGALTRHQALVTSPVLESKCPILHRAAANIGHYAIRQRGTLGGSLALADPASELPLMARLLDAEITLESSHRTRKISASDFFQGIFTTAREPDEMLTSMQFASLGTRDGWGFRAFARRSGDFFIVAAAVIIALDEAGKVTRLRLAVGGVGPIPVVLGSLESDHSGHRPGEEWARAVANDVAKAVEPDDTPHASAVFKRELVEVLARRALDDASRGAGAGAVP